LGQPKVSDQHLCGGVREALELWRAVPPLADVLCRRRDHQEYELGEKGGIRRLPRMGRQFFMLLR
jgi:hypothetical protein